jgi:DNA-binding cell septation regulator SpoVG
MSATSLASPPAHGQDCAIHVELRRLDAPSGKVVAFADVILTLPRGGLRLSGFSVYVTNGNALRVAAPARKGTQRYFDIVTLQGSLRHDVERAVIGEYERQANAASTP